MDLRGPIRIHPDAFGRFRKRSDIVRNFGFFRCFCSHFRDFRGPGVAIIASSYFWRNSVKRRVTFEGGWDFLVCCFSGHLLDLSAAAGTAAASAASAAASAAAIVG